MQYALQFMGAGRSPGLGVEMKLASRFRDSRKGRREDRSKWRTFLGSGFPTVIVIVDDKVQVVDNTEIEGK